MAPAGRPSLETVEPGTTPSSGSPFDDDATVAGTVAGDDVPRRALEQPQISTGAVIPALAARRRGIDAPPHGRTWSSIVGERSPMLIGRVLGDVVRAIETEPDPTATVRSSRDRLAEITHERDGTVQILDAWLAARSAAAAAP